MFGYEIINSTDLRKIKQEIEISRSHNRTKPKNMYCIACKHCVESIRYINEYPFMETVKLCDLDCDCENFERKK